MIRLWGTLSRVYTKSEIGIYYRPPTSWHDNEMSQEVVVVKELSHVLVISFVSIFSSISGSDPIIFYKSPFLILDLSAFLLHNQHHLVVVVTSLLIVLSPRRMVVVLVVHRSVTSTITGWQNIHPLNNNTDTAFFFSRSVGRSLSPFDLEAVLAALFPDRRRHTNNTLNRSWAPSFVVSPRDQIKYLRRTHTATKNVGGTSDLGRSETSEESGLRTHLVNILF